MEDFKEECKIKSKPDEDYLNALVNEKENIYLGELAEITGKPIELLYQFENNNKGRMICAGVRLTTDVSLGIPAPLKMNEHCGKKYLPELRKRIKRAASNPESIEKEDIESIFRFFEFYYLEAGLGENLRASELSEFLLDRYFFSGDSHLFDKDEKWLDGSSRGGCGFYRVGDVTFNSLEELTREKIAEEFGSEVRELIQTVNEYSNAIKDPHVIDLFGKYQNLGNDLETRNKQIYRIIREIRGRVCGISKLDSDNLLRRFSTNPDEYAPNFPLLSYPNKVFTLEVAKEYAESLNENAVRNIKGLIRVARNKELRRNKAYEERLAIKEKIREYFSWGRKNEA
ncbi:hypothetical protein A3K73_07275 [Candidatus Pacearchaeota archaeon RBG_13_36_9]|nr:MAG: hypothetical protein A3K73_07275 [Candidatus Pacearchaeota archaeon RBG_13_36_9]